MARRLVARTLALVQSPPRERALRILTYHRVNDHHPGDRMTVHPLAFQRQMEHIAESGRTVLPLDAGVARLRGEGPPLPPRALCLTFDDGYHDNFEHAAPILESFGFKATIYLVTGRMVARTPIERYRTCCELDSALSWDEARELHAQGHSLGGHGRTHRELAALDAASIREEVFGCRDDLLGGFGEPPASFCYPRGSLNPAVRAVVAEAGFASAVTVFPGANTPSCDPLLLRRTEVSGDDDDDDFRLKVDGVFDAWHRVRQRLQAARA
jgi:peptidoglycan/xylan/chitin deacetylase (PgdA/CDA1 family)